MGEDVAATAPLAGVRVVDFTRHMAGPYATQTLADYGADVVKVEALPRGDGSRKTGTVYYGEESGLFLMWNRGKRSVALDLHSEACLPVVDRLVADADVVIENFRPGVADELGIGYDRLRELNPRLIYVSVSAFGRGELDPLPGTDPVVQAMSGVMSVTGERDGDPVLVGVPIADFTGAMVAVQGTLLALVARHATGLGQRVDVSMLYGLLSALTTRLASYWADGVDPVANGSAHSVVAPYEAYRTADGHAVAGVWGAGEAWVRMCTALGVTELVDDPRFATNEARVENREALNEILDPIFESATTQVWSERFAAERALFGPVYRFSEILEHPHVEASGLIQSVDHPIVGPAKQLGPIIGLSETPGAIRRPPPVLGEHTSEVLGEAGFTQAEIEALVDRGLAMQSKMETTVS